jgi:hypothetical protein
MKKLLLIFTLLFATLVFSSPSYAGWTEVSENENGDIFYVDLDRIRKHDGYVYAWDLSNYLKMNDGYLSGKIYKQHDCKLVRFKHLSFSFHKQPMGRGSGDVMKPVKEEQGWQYPTPNSVSETILKSICSH